jgi:nitroreductase
VTGPQEAAGDPDPFADSLSAIDALLTTTRSVRKRLDLTRPVARAVIEECLQLAVHAPNAEGRQIWRWLVLTDAHRKHVLADYLRASWIGHLQKSPGSRRERVPRGREAGRVRSSDSAARDRSVSSAQYLVDNLERVPALIIPCVLRPPMTAEEARRVEMSWGEDPDAEKLVRRILPLTDSTYYGSIYPAIWSLQLALRSRGLGSTIVTSHLIFHDFIAAELGIPRQVRQIALMPVAHSIGADFQPARRVPAAEVTVWNEWGRPRGDLALRQQALAWLWDKSPLQEKGSDAK